MNKHFGRSLAAATVIAAIVLTAVPAGASAVADGATPRVSVERQLKKLKKKVKGLSAQVNALRGQIPTGPAGAAGPAGGDLTGSYPNPTLAVGAVTSAAIAEGAVTHADLASDSINSANVVDESLTASDIAGADLSGGGLSVPTGYAPSGRCRQLEANVGGAKAGEAVVFSVQAPLQDGVVVYGQRVPSDGHVTFDICNFSGTTQAAIDDIPVRIITFG